VPIVALTAQAFSDQVALCLKAGMDEHLTKPFTPETLLYAVRHAARVGSGCQRP
jgi:CheY-like chemotaxis protein